MGKTQYGVRGVKIITPQSIFSLHSYKMSYVYLSVPQRLWTMPVEVSVMSMPSKFHLDF